MWENGFFKVGLGSVGVNFGFVCYGRGGFFIVIDVNFFFGRIVFDLFF